MAGADYELIHGAMPGRSPFFLPLHLKPVEHFPLNRTQSPSHG
jgi:hypothetical protein